jgi:hypothetical protein
MWDIEHKKNSFPKIFHRRCYHQQKKDDKLRQSELQQRTRSLQKDKKMRERRNRFTYGKRRNRYTKNNNNNHQSVDVNTDSLHTLVYKHRTRMSKLF